MVLTRAERPLTTRVYQLADVTVLDLQTLAVKSSKPLIFIDKKPWVCSVDLEIAGASEASKYSWYFFVPPEGGYCRVQTCSMFCKCLR